MFSRFAAVFATLCVALCHSAFASAAQDYFKDWPAGCAPAEVGKRIAEEFTTRDILRHRANVVVYPEVCAWYGALTFSKLSGDKALQEKLVRRFDVFFTPEGAPWISWKDHVDYRVFGALPLELYLQTKDERYLKLGRDLADAQWKETTDDGITKEARYWIDDMYMIPVLQVQAYRATKEARYLDRAAMAMAAYLDKLQQKNGLFLHAPDSPFYWGRGNGWFAAGMAELLSDLPANHPKRARIMEGYQQMMASLLAFQADNGLWRQLVDLPESWPETSGSAMFAFAFVTGVKKGWLPAETYGPAARKAWIALVNKLDAKANLTEVCVGTNKGYTVAKDDLEKQKAFYLARERKAGDRHGQAPMLWTASALLR